MTMSSIPVFVVEDHNEVLCYIYRAIGSKRLPFESGTIVHFDSHPDLMIPENFDSSKIFEKKYVLDTVSIESWLLPAVYAKHFSSVAWIKPPWALQIPDGLHSCKIGRHKSTHDIRVTCPQSYFVGELAWADEGDLENLYDLNLEVSTLVQTDELDNRTVKYKDKDLEGHVDKSPSSVEHSFDSLLSTAFLQSLKEKPFVLDIDLDFYSTQNPFLNTFTDEQNTMLIKLCHYEHPRDLSNKILLSEVSSNRHKQITDLKSSIKQIKQANGDYEGICNHSLISLLDSLKESNPSLDLEMISYTGCPCDECILPHHVSTADQIHQLMNATKKFLCKLPFPSIITISRSSRDDYCPPKDVNFIQDLVLKLLSSVYGSLDIKLDYDEHDVEESTVLQF